DDAVLVDAAAVGEGVGADDGAVGLHGHAGDLGDVGAQGGGVVQVQAGAGDVFHVQGDSDFFDGGVAGAFADAVDGDFDLARAGADGGDAVGGGEAHVVVA